MTEQCFLAIDLGAESGRLMAGFLDGAKVRLEELHRFPNGGVPIGGTLRWDVLGLWREIQIGLAKAAALDVEIQSVGVDSWGVDYVLMSSDDELIGHPWHYRDERNNGMVELATQRVPREEIFASTGLQFMQINSLYQLLAMRQQQPALLEQAGQFLMIADYFHWCLCGSRVVEFTNATTTQMLHPVKRDWATDMLRKLELPTEILGDIVTPGTSLGKLRPEVAEKAGLPRINVVTPATHDTGSAVAAVPTEHTGKANWAYISSGTWSLMGVEVQDAIFTPEALELNVTNEGGIDGTYRLLKNIMGLWLVQECRRSFEKAGRAVDYAEVTKMAVAAAPLKSIINPNHDDFLSPEDMPTAIRERCKATGQPVPETDGELIRTALESLALKYNQVLAGLENLTGERVEVIHIVGGGSQNELLNQLTANACGRPVVAGPVEATAIGNVLVQARAAGSVSSLAEIRDVVRNSYELKTYEPETDHDWASAIATFEDLIKS
ncbi:MAG: rhamnulokinase [Planctomycetaceae bacterium]